MRLCRAVLSVSYANDMIHDRTSNGSNAGCVNILEDNLVHKGVFEHERNALLFRYDDNSLAECLDIVCNDPERAHRIAGAGMTLRDFQPLRFGGFDNILALARQTLVQPAAYEFTHTGVIRARSIASEVAVTALLFLRKWQSADFSVGKVGGFRAAPHQAVTTISSSSHCTVQP